MKTFCEVCTANPATLVCLADDAVMCDTCDKRCARDAGKTANRRKTEISFFPFRERRGAESRDTTGDETRGRLASRRAPSPCLAKARSTRRDRELNLAPPPPSPLYPTGSRSIHSANALVAKHERVAFTAIARPMCDICQVRETSNRRRSKAARRRAAQRDVRAVALRASRGRRRVAPTPGSKRVETTECRSLHLRFFITETPHAGGLFNEKASARFSRLFGETRQRTRFFFSRSVASRPTSNPHVLLPPLLPLTCGHARLPP